MKGVLISAHFKTSFVAISWLAIHTAPAPAQEPSSPAGDSIEAIGAFSPSGPPSGTPSRVGAGGGCIVDVRQNYEVQGTLTGTFEVDFRILVHGPCGSPAGTFEEEWIAVGRFSGVVAAVPVSSGLTYTAVVRERGDIRGTIKFGPELNGEVEVRGRFSDGRLTYAGWVEG